MKPRTINVHRYPAAHPEGRPPLLFVHGAYTDGRCWVQHFIPFFRDAGYDCYAIDLSGHGASSGHDTLDQFGLDDYVEDLAGVVDSLPAPPVLVAHSMGCVVVQRYLETGRAAAVAFLSPVPPTGTGGAASRLAMSNPEFFTELPKAVSGHATRKTLEVMGKVYFSPEMPPGDILQYLPIIQPESELAVTEMLTIAFRPSRRRPAIPALVMGGAFDAVFPASMLYFTALSWRAATLVIPGAGHMLMLDPQWEDAAGKLLAWVEGVKAGLPG